MQLTFASMRHATNNQCMDNEQPLNPSIDRTTAPNKDCAWCAGMGGYRAQPCICQCLNPCCNPLSDSDVDRATAREAALDVLFGDKKV